MDNQLTENIQNWVQAPTGQRNVEDGAKLLLKLNRNRWLYSAICSFPERYEAILENELKKHLRIRLDGLTQREVSSLDREVKTETATLLAAEKSKFTSTDGDTPTSTGIGRRSDHDSLPDNIKALFDNNGEVYAKIKNIYYKLLEMENGTSCDRYELLVQLKELDTKYHENLEAYDTYTPTADTLSPADDEETNTDVTEETDTENDTLTASRQISAARKYISENLAKAESTEDDTVRKELAEGIQARVDTILGLGGTFKASMRERLEAIGVNCTTTAETE